MVRRRGCRTIQFLSSSALEQSRSESAGEMVALFGPVDAEAEQESRSSRRVLEGVEVDAEVGEDPVSLRSECVGVVGDRRGEAFALSPAGVFDAVGGD